MLRKIPIRREDKIAGVEFWKLHNTFKGSLIHMSPWAFYAAARLDMEGFATLVWRELFIMMAEYVEDFLFIFNPIYKYMMLWKAELDKEGLPIRLSYNSTEARRYLLSAVNICMSAEKLRFRKLVVNCGALHCKFNMNMMYIQEILARFPCECPPDLLAGVPDNTAAYRGLQSMYTLLVQKKYPNDYVNQPSEVIPSLIRHLMASVLPMLVVWGYVENVLAIIKAASVDCRNIVFIETCLEIYVDLVDLENNGKKYGRERSFLIAMTEEVFRQPTIPEGRPPDMFEPENTVHYYDTTEELPELPEWAKRVANYEHNIVLRYGDFASFNLNAYQQETQRNIIVHIRAQELMLLHKRRNIYKMGVRAYLEEYGGKFTRLRTQQFVLNRDMLRSSGNNTVQHIPYNPRDYVWLTFYLDNLSMRSKLTQIFSDEDEEFDAQPARDYTSSKGLTSGDVLHDDNVVTVKCVQSKKSIEFFSRRNELKKLLDPSELYLKRYRFDAHHTTVNGEHHFCVIRQHVPGEVPDKVTEFPEDTFNIETQIIAFVICRYILNQPIFPLNHIAYYETQSGKRFFVALDDFVTRKKSYPDVQVYDGIVTLFKDNTYIIDQILENWQSLISKHPAFQQEFERLAKLMQMPADNRMVELGMSM